MARLCRLMVFATLTFGCALAPEMSVASTKNELRIALDKKGDLCREKSLEAVSRQIVTQYGLTNLKALAADGNITAKLLHAVHFDLSVSTDEQRRQSTLLWKQAAEAGSPRAMSQYGYRLEVGRGIKKSYQESRKWTVKSANAGCASGQYSRGIQFSEGKVEAKNFQTANTWFEKAAAQNHRAAIYRIGLAYETGRGYPKDLSKAKSYYRKSADLGWLAAKSAYKRLTKSSAKPWRSADILTARDWSISSAATILEKVDYSKNRSRIQKAASEGSKDAEMLTAFAYQTGNGESKDVIRASQIYGRLAEAGHPRAMMQYGYDLEFRIGDLTKAEKWYYRSYQAGNGLGAYNFSWAFDNRCERRRKCDRSSYITILKAMKFAADEGHSKAKTIYAENASKLNVGSNFSSGQSQSCRTVYDPKCTPNGGCQYRARQVCN